MAVVTSLGFSLYSTWDGKGARRAATALDTMTRNTDRNTRTMRRAWDSLGDTTNRNSVTMRDVMNTVFGRRFARKLRVFTFLLGSVEKKIAGMFVGERMAHGIGVFAGIVKLQLVTLGLLASKASVVVGAALSAIPLIFFGIGAAAAFASGQMKETMEVTEAHVKSVAERVGKVAAPILNDFFEKSWHTMSLIGDATIRVFEALESNFYLFTDSILEAVDVLFAGFADIAVKTGPLLDVLSRGLVTTAEAVVDFFKQLSTKMPEATRGLEALFSGIDRLLDFAGDVLVVLVEVGDHALPVMSGMFSVLGAIIRDLVLPLFEGLIPAFDALASSGLSDALKDIIKALSPIASSVGELISAIVALTAPIYVTFLSAIAPVVAALADAFASITDVVLELVKDYALPAVIIALELLEPVLRFVAQVLVIVVGWIEKFLTSTFFLKVVLPVVASVLVAKYALMAAKAVLWGVLTAGAWAMAARAALWGAAKMALAWVIALGPVGWILAAVIAVVLLIIAWWDKIKGPVKAVWDWIWEKISPLIDKIKAAWGKVKDAWERAWTRIKEVWDQKVQPVFDKVKRIWNEKILPKLERAWEKIKDAWERAWTKIKEVWDEHIKPIWDKVAGFLGKAALAALLMFLLGVLQGLLWVVERLADFLTGVAIVIEWWTDTGLPALSLMLSIIGAQLPAIDKLLSAIEAWPGRIWDSIVGWFDNPGDGDPGWWDGVSDWFGNLWSNIWGWLQQVPGNIWDAVVGWFSGGDNPNWWTDTVAHWFGGLWSDIWGWVQNVPGRIWDAIVNWFSGDGMGNIWWDGHSVIDWFEELWNNIWGWLKAAPGRIWDAIVTWFSTDPGWAAKVSEWMRNVWRTVSEWFAAIWRNISEWMASIWRNISEWWASIWRNVSEWLSSIWRNVSEWFASIWRNVSQWMASIWRNVSEWWSSIWRNVSTWLSSIWQNISSWFASIWQNISRWMSSIWQNISSWWSSIWQNVSGWLSSIWQNISGWFSSIWQNISGWWSSIWRNTNEWLNSIADSILGAFDNIKDGLDTVWGNIKDLASKAWEAVSAVISKPVEFVVNTLYNKGIAPVWNTVDNFMFGGDHNLPGITMKPQKRARGGAIHGPGTATSDSIPAWLSDGEYVVRAAAVRKYGVGTLNALNNMRVPSGAPGFALGGLITGAGNLIKDGASKVLDIVGADNIGKLLALVGKIASRVTSLPGMLDGIPSAEGATKTFRDMLRKGMGKPVERLTAIFDMFSSASGGGEGGGPGGYKEMFAWIQKIIPGVKLNSGLRPGDPGYHGRGLAVDLGFKDRSEFRGGGDAEKAFNAIVSAWRTSIAELIWDFSPWGRSKGIWNGREHTFGGASSGPGTHTDHIHWAQSSAGIGGMTGSSGGHGVNRWRSTVLKALLLARVSSKYATAVLTSIGQESSGRPNLVNNWDSNAKKGTPSKGLNQVIDPTFNAYAGKLRGLGVFNPLANIYASIMYAKDRYGANWANVMAAPGGYRSGGLVSASYDRGGMLQPGWTLAHNGTGRPEPVGHDLVEGRGGDTFIINFNGPVSDRQGAEDMVVRAITDAKKKGRIK